MTGNASPVEAKMVGEKSIMKGGGPNSALAVHPDRTGPPEGGRGPYDECDRITELPDISPKKVHFDQKTGLSKHWSADYVRPTINSNNITCLSDVYFFVYFLFVVLMSPP